MKNSIIIAFFLLVLQVKAQETYLMWNQVQTQSLGKETLFKAKNKLLNGKYKIAENSGAYTESAFKNGKMIGLKKNFDSSGNLIQEMVFNENGKPNGESISYYSDGKIYKELSYKDGLKVGTWKTYNSKGKLRKIEVYENDLKEGKWVSYFSFANSQVKLIETEYYHENWPTGTWTRKTEEGHLIWEKKYTAPKEYIEKKYFDNGKLESLVSSKDSEKHGICQYYNATGVMTSEKKFDAGHVTMEKYFYNNGNKRTIVHSKNSAKEGLYQEYSKTEDLIKEGQYKAGYKSGEWKYYEDKILKRMDTYANGRKNGMSKTYNAAAKVESEGIYTNNEKTGVWKYYKLNGKISKEVEYKNDTVISEKKYN